MSAVFYTIIRKRIFYKYQFRIQINKRANVGGIHLYKENETGLISCNDSILNIRNILFKLTNIYRIDAGENIYEEFNEIKLNFLNLIEQTKENKRNLMKPGPVSSSHIISRCIGDNKIVLEMNETERVHKVENILQNAKEIAQELKTKEPDDSKNIDHIINEVNKLNEMMKKRNGELIERAELTTEIIEKLNEIDDNDTKTLEYIDKEIVDLEIKRRCETDKEFSDCIQQFI